MTSTGGRRAFLTLSAAAGLWLLLAPSSRAAARDGAGTDLLGPDPLIYAELTRPGALLDRLEGDRVRSLLEAVPGYAEALDSPQLTQLRQAAELVAGRLGTTWQQALRSLTSGGIVLGIEEADPPRLILVVTPDDPEFLEHAHTTLVELAREDARQKGNPDPVKEAEYRGIAGYSLSAEEAHAIIDGRLVVTNGSDAMKAVIDRHLDGGKRLTDSDAFAGRRPDDSGPDAGPPLLWAFARVDRLRELDPSRFGGGEDEGGATDPGAQLLFGAWVELLQQTPFASARLDWTEDRLAASLTVATPEGGRSEIMSRFLPPEGEGAPAPIAVDGRLATINLWRDQMALWEVREKFLPAETLQGLAQLDSFAGTFFGGRDFGDSVLDPLGDRWQLVAALQNFDAMDPEPALKLPAFALVVDLDDNHPEFAQRLRVAFQSFLGLVNLGGAETGAPPLMLGSETHQGVTISKATFMPAPEPADSDADGDDEPAEVHYRNNYSPSIAEVDGRFIVSSSLGLTRSLIDAIRAGPEAEATDATLLMTADGPALAGLVDLNRERLVLQNMLERGNDRTAAERDVATLAALLRYLGLGALRLVDDEDASTLSIEFELGDPQ